MIGDIKYKSFQVKTDLLNVAKTAITHTALCYRGHVYLLKISLFNSNTWFRQSEVQSSTI